MKMFEVNLSVFIAANSREQAERDVIQLMRGDYWAYIPDQNWKTYEQIQGLSFEIAGSRAFKEYVPAKDM